jgi:hypothetical protein
LGLHGWRRKPKLRERTLQNELQTQDAGIVEGHGVEAEGLELGLARKGPQGTWRPHHQAA